MVLHHHMCIVFLPNTPLGILELPYCSSCRWLTFLKHCFWLVMEKNACDDKGPHLWINQNRNIDNNLYCSSNEFPNYLALSTMIIIY